MQQTGQKQLKNAARLCQLLEESEWGRSGRKHKVSNDRRQKVNIKEAQSFVEQHTEQIVAACNQGKDNLIDGQNQLKATRTQDLDQGKEKSPQKWWLGIVRDHEANKIESVWKYAKNHLKASSYISPIRELSSMELPERPARMSDSCDALLHAMFSDSDDSSEADNTLTVTNKKYAAAKPQPKSIIGTEPKPKSKAGAEPQTKP
uniref:Uncharacterized protein n=1 Tax=Magallana gigas TaxID=29159 RepID=K1PZ13_MAGGI